MSKHLVSDELWAAIEPLLPSERPKPKGGRPRRDDRVALSGIVFVLRSGVSWEMWPTRGGLLGDDLLATPARLAREWCLGAAPPRAPRALGRGGAAGLEPSRARQQHGGGKKGGAETGPNPTDRGKPGTKRHLVVDRRGTPLGVRLSPANRHDSLMLAPTLDAVPGVRHGRGRPRKRPKKLHADKAYDGRRCRTECRARSIMPRIARRGVETSERLGRHRWVVERTFAWLNRFRRLAIRLTSDAPTSTQPSSPSAAPSSASIRSDGFVRCYKTDPGPPDWGRPGARRPSPSSSP